MSIATIGLDIAKSVFQVHGIDGNGEVALRRKLQRSELIPLSRSSPRARWRWRRAVPHTTGPACWAASAMQVRLIAPEAVRPFVKRSKKNTRWTPRPSAPPRRGRAHFVP